MAQAFSQRVAAADWLADLQAWVEAAAERAGVRVHGPLHSVRTRPWAALLTAESDAGPLWVKANASALAFEPALHQALAELSPATVDAPLAIDPGRGWLLTRDRGAPLGEQRTPLGSDWRRVLVEAARLQRLAADRAEHLRATGLPDCSPQTVVDRFDRLVDLLAGLPDEHPSHLPSDLADEVRATRPRVVDAAALLAESTRLVTLQHGDLHPWNVFTETEGLRLFDFGDAQWAHAFEILRVPHAWVTDGFGIDWDPLLRAYLEVWECEPADVADLLDAAAVCHPVNRALTWWRCLEDATEAELAEWGDAPPFHLHGVTRA